MTASDQRRADAGLPLVVTSLLKGVVYRDSDERIWRALLPMQPQVNGYVATMGLTLVVDDTEGYAFLRSLPEPEDGESAAARLIPRRSLSFHVSLLLALLRKRLAEFDSKSSDSRLVLTREQVVDLVRVFLPESANEARLVDQVESDIAKAVKLGFLRRVRDQDESYEVRRVLKAFIDAQWLADFDELLARYAASTAGDREESAS